MDAAAGIVLVVATIGSCLFVLAAIARLMGGGE